MYSNLCYDIVYLYGLGLHAALEDGYSVENGTVITAYMRNISFEGT